MLLNVKKNWWLENFKKFSGVIHDKKDSLITRNEIPSTSKIQYDELEIWEDVLFRQRKKLDELYTNTAFPYIKKRNTVSERERFICKIEQIIELHLADTSFGVVTFSREMGMSRVHLYRMMKNFTDQSPSEYIRNYRLQKAAKLLAVGEESVSEVAYLTGFNDLSHFSKCFKKVFGVCPSEYKKVEIISLILI